MPSSLTWIDHDPAARERSLRILELFQEKETRDELGLGGIRDSIADQLFPGTSTIQTRLRYMLFVPWIYRSLEKQGVSGEKFAARADQTERALIGTLLDSGETDGVIGRIARERLKRLPSLIYWAGLYEWGIRRFDGSQDEYHQSIDSLYRRRKLAAPRDDGDMEPDSRAITWHPKLPEAPEEFPQTATLALRFEEARFIRERIAETQGTSLLCQLVIHLKRADVEAPWDHPDFASFPYDQRELLTHARRFSVLMHGAAILYNLRLSELKGSQADVEASKGRFYDWSERLDRTDLAGWSLPRLWELVRGHGHAIDVRTTQFVERWFALAQDDRADLAGNEAARQLIEHREKGLKGVRSRFSNRRALDQWRGESGLRPLVYRWPTARTFLRDLHAGLRGS